MRVARSPRCKKSLALCRSNKNITHRFQDLSTYLSWGAVEKRLHPALDVAVFCLGCRKGSGSHDRLDLLVGVCFLFCFGSTRDRACVAGWCGGRANGLAAHASRKHCASRWDQHLRLIFDWVCVAWTSLAVFGKCFGRRCAFVGGGAGR